MPTPTTKKPVEPLEVAYLDGPAIDEATENISEAIGDPLDPFRPSAVEAPSLQPRVRSFPRTTSLYRTDKRALQDVMQSVLISMMVEITQENLAKVEEFSKLARQMLALVDPK